MKIKYTLFLVTLVLCGTLLESYAQEPLKPRPSPLEMVTLKYEGTYIKITYGRPHKRDREIFGGLEPYGKIWRTGANEATEISVTDRINFGGKSLDTGTYTLFTIPYADKWTIILNSELGQWGAYNYNEKFDVIRFDIPTQQTEVVYEPFTMEFEQEAQSANLVMKWDRTSVSIPITF